MSITKLLLCLLVIAGIGIIAWTGYRLFTHQIAPLIGTIALLAEIGLLVWIISLLRSSRFRWKKPSFKLVFWPLIAISLVCAFAGIEPMSSTKNDLADFISQSWQDVMSPSQPSASVPAEQVPTPSKSPPTTESQAGSSEPPSTSTPQVSRLSVLELEQETFRLINAERERAGVQPTKWDDKLYKLSKAHTEEMANRGELFHTPMNASYGENCWGGKGYYSYSGRELARVIVDSWMTSPLHRDWLLHKPIRTSVVSIVLKPDGQYASWTFWTNEVGEGPPLVRKIADEWQRETGGNIPWLEWLEMKGYIE